MVNLLRLCERMTNEYVNQSYLDKIVEWDFFKEFAKRNHFTIFKLLNDTGYSYRLKREKVEVCYLSNMQKDEFSWLDLADLHIGHKNFNEALLRNKLQQAVDRGIKVIFIAGDIFEGIPFEQTAIAYHDALKIQDSQIHVAYSIFKDYPLTYYAINGNHEYTFELVGLHNPIDLLQRVLRMSGCDFNYIDTYMADFIISGFCKRLIHIERYVDTKYGICAIERYKRFTQEEMNVEYNGVKYPIRFFTCGHIHVPMDIFYRKKNVYISQPGSFANYYGDSDDPGIFVSGKIENGKITRYK